MQVGRRESGVASPLRKRSLARLTSIPGDPLRIWLYLEFVIDSERPWRYAIVARDLKG